MSEANHPSGRSRFASSAAVAVLAWACAGAALAQGEAVATARADAPAAPVDPTAARLEALEAQIRALQDQVADLKASTAANIQVLRTDQQATTVSLANGRPTFATGDGRFTASIRGVFQLDAAHYDQDAPGPLATDFRRGSFNDATENDHARDLNDGANFRRARLGVEGKAFGDFEYNFLYDFGGSGVEDVGKISSAYAQYNGFGPAAKLRIGAFSPPSGLDEAASTNGSLFAERAAPADLVRGIGAGDGRTAIALLGNGERWTYTAALTGNVIGTTTFDEQSAFVGRITHVPLKGYDWLVHVGASTTYVIEPAAGGPDVNGAAVTNVRLRERPELRVDGARLVDTNNINADSLLAYGLELGLQRKNLFLQSEYFGIDVERKASTLSDPDFSGWYVAAGWTITGEPRRYEAATGTFNSPKVDKPFSLKDGQWGVWELGLRYSNLDLNYHEGSGALVPVDAIRGGEQEIFTFGLNWYLNAVLRFQAAYQSVSVDRLSPGGAAFSPAGAPAGSTPPAGAQVGQDLNIFSLRTQYAF